MWQRRCFTLVCGFIITLWGHAAIAALTVLGPVTSTTPLANGALMNLTGGGKLRIEFLERGIVHVEVSPPGMTTLATTATLPVAAAAGSAEVFEDGTRVFVRQGGLTAIVGKNPMQVVLMRADGSVISADFPGGALWDSAAGTVVQVKHVRSGERFFGMGLAAGPLDRRGRQMTMRNTDNAAYGPLTNPLYSSTPFFYGHTGGATYGLYLDNPSISVFDFGQRSPDVMTMAATGGTLNYYVLAGPTPAAVAQSFAALTGSTPLPPRWALGYLQAHFGYASATEVLGLANEFRTRQIPCDAFFLDLDYTDRLFTLTWNPVTFPNPVGFTTQMHGMGFRTVNIMEPLVTVFDPLWSFLAGSGYLVTDPSNQPYVSTIWMGNVSWVDFSKPAARDFFKTQLKNFISTGVSGLWADLNEPAANEMPYARFDFNGQPRLEYNTRNIFALIETAALKEALQEAQPGLRPFIVSRSGFVGIQRHAANWSGDTESTFNSLRDQVQIAASMGLSGQNLFGADVGGFLGAPNAELFVRWLQFASMTPLMRNHSMNTSPAREPWRFGEPYTSVAKSTIEWRYRLMPYLYGLFAQHERDGTPVLAPTFFHFPADAATHSQNGEFMLGQAMLVAPVVTEGAVTRRLYLPAGANWIDYNTDAAYAGGQQIDVAAPLQQMPLFVRAGSVVPLGPVRQHAAQVVDESLLLDVFPGANGSFTLHDDDGATTAYRSGSQRETPLVWTESATTAQLSTGPVTGTQAAIARPWWIQVRRWNIAPTRVTADGVVLAQAASPSTLGDAGGWSLDTASHRLIIRLPGRQPAALLHIDR